MGMDGVLAGLVSVGEQASEQAVLERTVEVADEVVGAACAAVLLVEADGRPAGLAHRGLTGEQVATLPHVLRQVEAVAGVLRGRPLHLADLRLAPDAAALPTGAPAAGPLLGVPLTVSGRVLGALYLARPPGSPAYRREQRACAEALARQTGLAIARLRERQVHDALVERLGVPDGRAGDLPGSGEPSPVLTRLLATARQVLGMDLVLLSRLHDDRQTFTHADAAHGGGRHDGRHLLEALEGATVDASAGYCSAMVSGEVPHSVPDVPGHPLLGSLPVTAALGVGAYCGVPVHLPDGTLHGTLCGLDAARGAAVTTSQLEQLSTIARLIGARLQHELDSEQRRRAAALAFQPLIDGPLRTTVVQPIVDLATGTAAGFEALSRFGEHSGAPRAADEVFGSANRLGLGLRLEQAAARSALALLPRLPAAAYLSVNLSPLALLDPVTGDLLTRALARGAAGRLVLELTEHESVPDYPALLRALGRLRERGARLAIDDVGAGFASLQHITRLAPEIVKLDRAFVRDVDEDEPRRAVARAMVRFAGDIGAHLVAEGIETPAELDTVVGLGATYGQGYHLGRPAPAPDLDPVPGAG